METCDRCNKKGEDRRTLWMACLYNMGELQLPLQLRMINDENGDTHRFFTLQVCKRCRGEWMRAIQKWFKVIDKDENCGSCIYIRENGVTFEITEEEWYRRYPHNISPVRFKEQEE